MTLPEQLLGHAAELVVNRGPEPALEVRSRRAISAAYYSLFHLISQAASEKLAPDVSPNIRARVARWLNHTEMKIVCGRFTRSQLDQPLRDLIGDSASSELQMVASSFIQLQEARHLADCDAARTFTQQEAQRHVQIAIQANRAWSHHCKHCRSTHFFCSPFWYGNNGRRSAR